ncbi:MULTISPECIES: hypothetical protein [Paracoccus]|uniref:hypothetical protein n=1 Tax=Paracoccus TaxID=265 RepID=UPI001FB607F6|nr:MULTISPECIES: hypothetical protein [Paracoccus]MCJ1903040.1 hypothetical protein [Paracoccus versutus]MDF3907099.1 hypothetical protein [Paracoccus sp. AS002]
MSEFESLELKSGIWQGVIHRDAQPGRLVLVHMGSRVAEARLTAEAPGRWRVAAAIPAERLSEGAQSFLLVEDGGAEGEPPRPGACRLASLTLVAGEILDGDLHAELSLMRGELELLKKELRRLAAAPA